SRRLGVRAEETLGHGSHRACRGRVARFAALAHGQSRVPLPRRLLHGRGARPGEGRHGDRCSPPRPSPRARRLRSSPHGPAALEDLDRRGDDAQGDLRVSRDDVRLRRGELRPGRMERAAHEARLDRLQHPVGAPPVREADLARRARARRSGNARAAPRGQAGVILRTMTTSSMVFLGFGKYAPADKIYALEPITGDDRGGGRRTRVWVEGLAEPLVASRTERTILHDMGHEAGDTVLLDGALDLAERLAAAADEG